MNSTTDIKPRRVLAQDDTRDSSFLFLPVELRLEIYKYSIIDSRRPRAEDVHNNLLSAIWEDRPSPLLGMNKQIRAEVCDLLQRSPFTMRITWEDKKFDGLALSSFIAQRRKGYEDIPHLVVEIWPPHPDRPCDFSHIWEHLRELRDDLKAVPRIARLDLLFLENEIASWSDRNGRPRKTARSFFKSNYVFIAHKDTTIFTLEPRYDIEYILESLQPLTNVGKVHISLPDCLLGDRKNLDLRTAVFDAKAVMTCGLDRTFAENQNSHFLDFFSDCLKPILEIVTAKRARNRLDAISEYGLQKISDAEYEDFVRKWPHLDEMTRLDRGDGCRGKVHCVERSVALAEYLSPYQVLQKLLFWQYFHVRTD